LKYNNSHILEVVFDIAGEILGLPRSELKKTDMFREDLGADSMDMFEIRVLLEEKFEMTIPDKDVKNITSIEETYKYIKTKL
jgi:acyl carrier protein